MSTGDGESEETQEPGECLACRGTGTLISGLGGTPHDVRCPWCQGTGTRIPGIDAQAHPAEGTPPGDDAAQVGDRQVGDRDPQASHSDLEGSADAT